MGTRIEQADGAECGRQQKTRACIAAFCFPVVKVLLRHTEEKVMVSGRGPALLYIHVDENESKPLSYVTCKFQMNPRLECKE